MITQYPFVVVRADGKRFETSNGEPLPLLKFPTLDEAHTTAALIEQYDNIDCDVFELRRVG